MREPPTAYRDDLAMIHDAGFGDFAGHAAPWLIEQLRAQGFPSGRVTELGCGSGISAAALFDAGYDVLGFDISPAMIALARGRAPRGEFHVGSFVDADIAPSVAVTAIGEIFNYLFDRHNTPRRLAALFGRIHAALEPGGLFVFDVATPGRVPEGRRRGFTEGEGWACLYEAEEDSRRGTLTRRITSFRRVNRTWRRDQEVHELKLYEPKALAAQLRGAGFRVRTLRGYGEARFPVGYVGFMARKA
jgi:SAM-dependent methyltransferase